MQIFESEAIVIDQNNLQNTQLVNTTVYEAIELKSQKDFSLTGNTMFTGSGFEPGFAFKLNLAGTKFGLDLSTQNGLDDNGGKYVGYISLTGQSTTTKTFEGKVLDNTDKIQDLKLEIINKKCGMPSGETVAYTSKITVGDKVKNEKLTGCAELKI